MILATTGNGTRSADCTCSAVETMPDTTTSPIEKRLAAPAQRIVLYANDRGCTAPGCDVPGYFTEVHHVTAWAKTQTTAIDNLTLACGPHHKLAEQGWATRKTRQGLTEWIPPPHLDNGQPRTNTFHHPEKLLCDDDL